MRHLLHLFRSHSVRAVATSMVLAIHIAGKEAYCHASSSSDASVEQESEDRVAKHWLLDDEYSRRLNRIKISTPGLTYISVSERADEVDKGDDRLGIVRMTADNVDLLDCLEVVPMPPNGVEIRFKKGISPPSSPISGHLLTELFLDKAATMNNLSVSGGGVVVVEDQVLVSAAEYAQVKLNLNGSGRLYAISESDININKLSLSVAGSGRMQFVAPKCTATEEIRLQVAGSGNLRVVTDRIQSSTIKSSVAGSGYVTSVSSNLAAHKLKSSIAGYGDIKYIGNGSASIQRVAIAGSGQVESREIISENATVKVVGSGEATLAVENSLEGTCAGSGLVKYVDTLPKRMKATSLSFERAEQIDRQERLDPWPVPSKEAAFKEIEAAYDPEATRYHINGDFDLFGAFSKFKRAFGSSYNSKKQEKEAKENKER